MDPTPVAKSVAGHGPSMPLFRIGVPEQSGFPDLVDQLLVHSFELENRQRVIREKTFIARRSTCILFVEGLHQAFASHVPDTSVAFPHSQRFYGKEGTHSIYKYTYRNVNACYQALLDLGWVSYCTGFLDQIEQGQPTTIAPDGALLQRFSETKPHWNRVSFTSDPIVVRIKNKATGTRRVIDPPDTPEVHLMRQQMHQMNDFLCDQAIHLNLPNGRLKALSLKMASTRYSYEIGAGRRRTRARILNFAQVGLRRIFSKGQIDRGGRLFGGWWQTIPKDYRRYVSINGRPTVEVDFSEMHPSMLYILDGQRPPQNIYDLGIIYPEEAPYDPNVQPHKARRKTIKRFLNALINDEREQHRLSKTGSRQLKLSHEQLKELVLTKHPVIAKAVGTDTGSYLQYLDSRIACGVMLRLMNQGIVALPVHDSFLVQREFESELITAMQAEFKAVMGVSSSLKETELPIDGFEKLQKRRDLNPLIKAHRDSVHDRYVRSWRSQHLEPNHQNLSFYPPYRFPDEPHSEKDSHDRCRIGGKQRSASMQGYYVKQ
jgi:hypothetical protein